MRNLKIAPNSPTMTIASESEAFPSKVDPEVYPDLEVQDIEPEDCPKSFIISLTDDNVKFLKSLISEQANSPVWILEVEKIRKIIQAVAHEVKILLDDAWYEDTIPDTMAGIDEYIDEGPQPSRSYDYDNLASFRRNKFTLESPFI